MDKKIKYVCLAMAMILGNVAIAQNTDKTDLNKNITLEREFDPVKKTVVKKTVLPKEIKKWRKTLWHLSSATGLCPHLCQWRFPLWSLTATAHATISPTSEVISSWGAAPISILWQVQATGL